MYVKVYILWFKLVLVELIPYILMAVLNTVIIIYAKKSSSQFSGEQRNNTARQESRMVTVLVLVVFLFIITQSFKLVPDIVEVVLCATGKSSPPDCWNEVPGSVSIISMIAHVCLSFNSSANFLVYVVWGTKFRRALLGLLRRRRPQNPRDETGATRTSPTLTNTYIKKAANRREIAVYTESHSLACVPLPREIGSSSSGGKKSLRFVVEIQDTAV
ncbi:FMRFamide receptor [Eurytemora carolleeae]|uniref:FMRFamide receptor n=1 Tax=Eurytemora carolleeae TaxID=1294199 RepID=UPI000C766146|nr:FMRFamide receptor [Eurytemora carolleeae]|eukprot:XP_023324910.1 FMRFamide receptor-like [Eurytemora affinis]